MRRHELRSHSSGFVLMALAGAALFGTAGVARALGPNDAPASAVGASRVLVGGILLATFALLRGNRFRVPRSMPMVTIVLATSVACYQAFFFDGIARTGVAVGTIVTVAAVPTVAGLLALIMTRQAPTRRWLVATGFGLIGTILVGRIDAPADVDVTGVVECLIAGSAVAVFLIFSKRLLSAGASVLEVSTLAVALSGLLLLPVLLTAGASWLLTPGGAALAIYLGVATGAVGFFLTAYGLGGIRPTTAATLGLAEPLTATVLAFLILDERLTPIQIAGAAAVFVGLFILARERQEPVEEQRQAVADHEQVLAAGRIQLARPRYRPATPPRTPSGRAGFTTTWSPEPPRRSVGVIVPDHDLTGPVRRSARDRRRR